jgi:SanA protein
VAAAPINYGGQTIRNIREYLAISKDFVMTFIKPEPTVLGNPISLDGSGDVTNGAD